MEFKTLTADDGTKVLHFRESPDHQLSTINLGNVTLPTDPVKLFEWMTGKLKEHGLVPENTKFRLGD